MLRCFLPAVVLVACTTPTPPPSPAAKALRAKAWHALVDRRYDEVEVLLQQAAPLGEGALDRVRIDYYRGLLARALGDYRGALSHLEAALEGATRLGARRDAAMAAEMLGGLLQDLGRHREARVIFERLPTPADAGDRARRLVNEGWLLWRGVDAGAFGDDLAEIERRFAEAWTLESNEAFRANLAVNLAGVALARGDHRGAGAHLAATDGLGHAALVAGELALAEGDAPGAAGHFERAAGADVRWRGRYGLARARTASGDEAGALVAWREALAGLERAALGAGLRSGRAPYLADRRAVVDDALDALVAAGRVAEAFEVACTARARVLRALEAPLRIAELGSAARADWSRRLGALLTARDAFERAATEVELLAGPALRTWRRVRADEAKTLVQRFEATYAWLEQRAGSPTPADVASVAAALKPGEALLAFAGLRHAFWITRDGVDHAQTSGEVIERWFETRPSHLYVVGGPASLRARVGARFSMSSLPRAGSLTRVPVVAAGRALVVADSRRDLRGARAEGAELAARTGARLLTGAGATRVQVLDAMRGASLFHFAGHGVLDHTDPWQAHLALADGARLTVADVLSARPRLGLVVLDGCETGRAGDLGRGAERLGLPEAFLAAGARTVLSADRVLDDAAARRFITRFYSHGGATQPGEALRRATADAIREGDETWTAFHLAGRR